MRTKFLLMLALIAATLSPHYLLAQEYSDIGETGFYGYTTIYYDPTSLDVTAYSETDLYGASTYYYEARVQVTSNGYQYTDQSPNPNTTYASASVVYQGTAGQTYTATGTHSAVIAFKYIGLADDDYYGADQWLEYDIDTYYQYPFTAFSPDTYDNGAPIDLGTTYDTAEATIPATCGDQRTTIIAEYTTYHAPYFPQCSEFTQTSPDPSITFAQFNSSTYSWAIIRSWMIPHLDQVHSTITQDSFTFTINSAYRNPAKEYSINGGRYTGSRHIYGDAVDLATTSTNWATFQAIGHANQACVEPTSVQGGSTAHSHMDWRTFATIGPTTASCPKGW